MKKSFLLALALSFVIAVAVYAESHNILSRLGPGVFSFGSKTIVTSDHATRAFKFEIVTATVAGAATASTNSFSETYSATPSVFAAPSSGNSFGVMTPVTITPSTTQVIVSGLSTNNSSATNNIQLIVYGYTRTGTLE